MPTGISFGFATCVASWVMLCCGLKPTTGCVVSGSTWEGLQCRLMSDTVNDWPCMELPSGLQFVAASIGSGACGRGQAV